jgi:ketosteroid isomerase-like protein
MIRNTLVLAALCLACQAPPPSAEQQAAETQAAADSAKAAISEASARYTRYVNANQADSIGALFAADGVLMPPDAPMAAGTDSIVATLKTMTVPGGTLTLASQNVSVSGDMAVARGTFSYTAPAQGGMPALDVKGKYLEHWHRMDGQWRLVEDIWNNDAPQPAAPPPPKR